MITYTLILIATIFKAIADTCADHYSISIFKNLNPIFWNKQVSWQGKKFLGIVVLDAWHLCMYAMFTCLFASIIFYVPVILNYDFAAFWVIYFITFETFYSHLLIK